MGCHAREGFDPEPQQLRETQRALIDLLTRKNETQLQIERTIGAADQAQTKEEAERLYAEADALTMSIAGIDTEFAHLQER